MEKPKEINKCPCCGACKMVLTQEKMKHIPKNGKNILEGLWWKYHCKNCDEKFTTTESDTISLKQFNHRKL